MQTPGIDAIKLSFRCCVAAGTISSGRIFFFSVRPTASESICRCEGTSEGGDSAPLVTCSEGFWLIEHFQEAYTRLFSLCHNKQDIHSNWHYYSPAYQGSIYVEVYPKGVQPIRGTHPGLIPISAKLTKKKKKKKRKKEIWIYWKATEMAMRPFYPLQTHSHEK